MVRVAASVAVLAGVACGASGQFILEPYFDQKVFGESPGPCTKGSPCKGSITDVPASVKNTIVCVDDERERCGRFGDVYKRGSFEIWDLRCERVQIGPAQLKNVERSVEETVPILSGELLINFGMKCSFMADVIDFYLDHQDFSVKGTVTDSKLEFDTTSSSSGRSTLESKFLFKYEIGDTIDTGVPQIISIPEEECLVTPNLDIKTKLTADQFDFLEMCAPWLGIEWCATSNFFTNIIFSLFNWSAITDGYFAGMDAVFGSMVCAILSRSTIEDGIIVSAWNSVRDELLESSDAKPDDLLLEDSDDRLLVRFPDELTQEKLDNCIDFSTSTTVDLLSASLNNYLGGPTRTDSSNLVVNELVESLTDPPGHFSIEDIVSSDFQTSFNTDWSRVSFKVDSFNFEGLNTFTDFSILQNGLGEVGQLYRRTLSNQVTLDKLSLGMTGYVKFARGPWVTQSCNLPRQSNSCEDDSYDFTFRAEVTTENLELNMALNTAVNPSEIDSLVVGQLLWFFDAERFSDKLFWLQHCVARSFYSMFSPSLEGTTTKILDPTFTFPEDTGLGDFPSDVAEFIAEATRGFFADNFGGFMQGPVRDELNFLLFERFIRIGKNEAAQRLCPQYEVELDDQALLTVDWEYGYITYVYDLINEGVGGNPILNTNSDINELVDQIIKYYEVLVPELILDSWDNYTDPPVRLPPGYWELEDQYHDAMTIPAYKQNADANYLAVRNVAIVNVNSIYVLEANYFDDVDPGMKIDFGFGGAMASIDGGLEPETPLEFKFQFDVFAEDGPLGSMSEVWDFVLTIRNLDFQFVIQELEIKQINLYELVFKKAQHVPCLLQTLNRVLFPEQYRKTSIETLDFDITQVSGALPNDPTNPRIVDALWGVAGGLGGEDLSEAQIRTQKRFIAFVNAVFNGTFNYYLSEVEDIPVYYSEDGINSANCLNVANPVPSFENPFFVPNGTYFSEVCLAELNKSERLGVNEIENTVTSYNGEAGLLYDMETSFYIETLQGLARNRDTFRDILFGLADSSGTIFSDLFVNVSTPDGLGRQVNLELPLEHLGFKIDMTPEANEDPDKLLIHGLVVDAGIMKVEGIDRLADTFSVFEPVGPMTLANSFTFTEENPLKVTIESYIEIPAERLGETGEAIREDLTTTFTLTDVKIDFNLIAAINADLFGNLTLAHLFRVEEDQGIFFADHSFNCLLSTIFDGGLFLSILDMDVVSFDGPKFSSERNELVSPALTELIDATLEVLKEFYQEAIPNMSHNCLRTFINDYFRELWVDANESGACPPLEDIGLPALEPEDEFYKFNKAEDFLDLQEFFEDYLFADDLAVLGTILDSAFNSNPDKPNLFLESEGNQVEYNNVPIIYNSKSYGEFDFMMANMQVQGFKTLDRATILEPYFWVNEDDETFGNQRRRMVDVNTTLTPEINVLDIPYMTVTKFFLEGPFSITTDIQLNVSEFFETFPAMFNDIRITITASDVDFGLELMSKIDIAKALTRRFSSVSDFEELPCLLVPFTELEPLDFNLTLRDLQFEIECLSSCDLFEGLGAGLEAGGKLTNDNAEEIGQLFNTFIDFVVSLVDSRGIQSFVDSYLASSEKTCNTIYGVVEDSFDIPTTLEDDIATYMGYGFVGVVGFIGTVSVSLIPIHRKRRKVVLARALSKRETHENSKEVAGILAMMELTMRSIFEHPATPIFAKYLIPVVCIVNIIGLVVAVVFTNAASVVIQFTAIGQTSQRITLVPFTVVSSINDIYNSGAWPLALLIAFTSIGWPIFKNVILMVLWFSPATIIRGRSRRYYLEWMDLLGKWSFFDVYVVVIMLAAMKTYVNASYYSYTYFLADTFFATEVNVKPELGIIVLCLVAASSLLINHVVIAMHDRVQRSNDISEDKINDNHVGGKAPARAAVKRKVSQHVYVGKDKEGRVRYVSKKATAVIALMLALSLLSFVIGANLPLIKFEHNGLVGRLLEELEDNAAEPLTESLRIKRYTLFQLGATLSEAPADSLGDSLAILFFQLLFFICVLVGPVATMGLCSILYFRPSSLPGLRSMLYWTKIAFCWSALEVLVVSLVATISEIGSVSQFIVDFITNDACGYIQAAIAQLVENPERDAFCLDVVGEFDYSAFLFFGSIALQLFTYYVVTVITRSVVDDRYYASYHELRADVRPKRLGRLERFTLRLFTSTQVAPEEGIEGVSAFVGLDAIDNDHVDIEKDCCGRFSDFCCDAKEGEVKADARIDAWQAKFGVIQDPSEATNPVYEAPTPSSMPSRSPFISGISEVTPTEARSRATTDDSVEV